MVRKTLKVVDVDTSYDDVVDEVVGNADDAVVEETPQTVDSVAPEETPEAAPEETVEVTNVEKPKKTQPMGTCEACGKTMTMKNLKYAHKFICSAVKPANVPAVEVLEVSSSGEEEAPVAPPKPKAKAKAVKKAVVVSAEPDVKNLPKKTIEKKPKPAVEKAKPKAQAKPAAKPEPEQLVPMRKPRAIVRAEHYAKLASHALP